MSVNSLIQRFDTEVKVSDIKVDWDSGHCWSYIHHPLMDEVREMDLSEEDEQLWDEYTTEWLYDNDPQGYCVPELINELNGKRVVVSDECGKCVGDVVGFINLVRNHTDDPTGQLIKWYCIEKLEKWVHIQNLYKIVRS